MTNKELQEWLKQYPDDAEITIDAPDSFDDPGIGYALDGRISWDSKNEEIVIDVM